MRVLAIVLLLVAASGVVPAAGEVYFTTVRPVEGERFKEANFSLWAPDGQDPVRGVIVHQHGCGDAAQNAGKTAVFDLHWRELARQHDCVLIGTSLWPEAECWNWCHPEFGSGRAFLDALETFATESGRPGIAKAPWVLWGHSGGGHWAYCMAIEFPERVSALVLQSAATDLTGQGASSPPMERVPDDVPVLIHIGLEEKGHDRFARLFDQGLALFESLRSRDAPVTIAVDPRSGHACGDARYLTIPWISACLGGWSATAGAVRVRYDLVGGEVWLPTRSLVPVWKSFVRSGKVTDHSPPRSAPTALRPLHTTGKEITLTWEAIPDFESGIRTFTIYRDGVKHGGFRAPTRDPNKSTQLFRKPNDSDTPDQPLSEMRFTDKEVMPGERYRYEVATVNWAGAESPRSEAVEVTAGPARDGG